MIRIKQLLAIAFVAVAATGCIRDKIDECPPLTITLTVKDKNYANIDDVALEPRRDTDLPFRDYISNIHWSLRDANSGSVVAESPAVDVTDNEQTARIVMSNDLPFGEYVLTVWGGLNAPEALTAAKDRLTFHPANDEGDDVYMTSLHLTYDAWHYDFTAAMERTKGKLIIEKLNLPAEVTSSEKTITGLYGSVDHRFAYSGQTSVTKHSPLTPSAQIVSTTLLAPTIDGEKSVLKTVFNLADGSARADNQLRPADVELQMKRNELTVVRYVWNAEAGDFNVELLIDGEWHEIVNLEVEI